LNSHIATCFLYSYLQQPPVLAVCSAANARLSAARWVPGPHRLVAHSGPDHLHQAERAYEPLAESDLPVRRILQSRQRLRGWEHVLDTERLLQSVRPRSQPIPERIVLGHLCRSLHHGNHLLRPWSALQQRSLLPAMHAAGVSGLRPAQHIPQHSFLSPRVGAEHRSGHCQAVRATALASSAGLSREGCSDLPVRRLLLGGQRLRSGQ
jgi:hypothetical protein